MNLAIVYYSIYICNAVINIICKIYSLYFIGHIKNKRSVLF